MLGFNLNNLTSADIQPQALLGQFNLPKINCFSNAQWISEKTCKLEQPSGWEERHCPSFYYSSKERSVLMGGGEHLKKLKSIE